MLLCGSKFTTQMPPYMLSTTILGFDCVSDVNQEGNSSFKVFPCRESLESFCPQTIKSNFSAIVKNVMPYLDVVFWTDKFIGFLFFLQECVRFGKEWWSLEPCRFVELGCGNSSRGMVSWVELSRDIEPLLWP